MKILNSLSIWPTYSCEEKFIDATSGILYPPDILFFFFQKNTNFYKYNKNSNYYNILKKLGAKTITELEYVRDHLLSGFTVSSTPSQEYVDFLQNVLTLKNPEIEKWFSHEQLIPNRSLTAFVSANTLYDMKEPLFNNVFAESDKILPPKLQNDVKCTIPLRIIGIKWQVNNNTFIECA